MNHISYLIFALLFSYSYSQCFQLTGSTTCGAFSGSLLQATKDFKDVETLDAFVSKRVGQVKTNKDYINKFRSSYDCPKYEGDGQEHLQSIFCSQLIAESIKACKQPKAPLLCLDTCKTAIKSLVDVFRSNSCNSPSNSNSDQIRNRNDTVGVYHNLCYTKGVTSGEKGCVVTPAPTESGVKATEKSNTDKAEMESATFSSDDSTDSNDSSNADSNDSSEEKSSAEATSSSKSNFIIGNNTLLYSIIGCSIAAVFALIAGAVLYKRKYGRSQNPFKGTNSFISSGSASDVSEGIVTKSYYPNLSDEIALHVGDRIEILEVYDDGWALGDNVNTGIRGVFPMNSIKPSVGDGTVIEAPSCRASSLYSFGNRF
jgi:hypothetical protein